MNTKLDTTRHAAAGVGVTLNELSKCVGKAQVFDKSKATPFPLPIKDKDFSDVGDKVDSIDIPLSEEYIGRLLEKYSSELEQKDIEELLCFDLPEDGKDNSAFFDGFNSLIKNEIEKRDKQRQ